MDGSLAETVKDVGRSCSSNTQDDVERKARVDAMWEQMNKGVPIRSIKSPTNKPSLNAEKTPPKTSTNWMTVLGLAPNKVKSSKKNVLQIESAITENGCNGEAKKIAAAALAAVKDATAASVKGKVEIRETKDFAGQDIEVKKLVDADSKLAIEMEMAKASVGPPSAVDAILEQIKKKQKLSVLDKTKQDWGGYKGENKGVEEELDAYKKSSNQYLDKQAFLERADYREFERERDARLALHGKRKTDMRED